MKRIIAAFALCLSLVCVSRSSFADTLHFVSDSGVNTGGENIYPYNFNVNGSTSVTQLMCLDLNRSISAGETWSVNTLSVPTDGSQNSVDYRADAWIFSQLGSASTSDVQWAVWSIFDPSGTKGNSAFNANAQQLASTGLKMAVNQNLISSGFFSNFVLYTPDMNNQAGWTDGIPQDFIGTAQTPEPSSFLLLGSGLIGVAGTLRRKLVRK